MLIEREKIHKAKEKLGDRNAELIAELLKLEKWDSKNKKGCCCFHEESTPSAIYNSKSFSVKCFGCGVNFDIIDAHMKATGGTYLDAIKYLFDQAKLPYSFGEKGIRSKHQYRYPKEESPLEDNCQVYRYLEMRSLSKNTIDTLGLRQDEHGNIAFPFYDANDVLCMVKYRPARKVDHGEIKSWCQKEKDTTPLLFNMNRVNINSPLVITEGELDCAAVIESGYTNAVSVPFGANNYAWIEENFDWLEQFDNIIICSDNDEAGTKMQKECIYRLGSWRTKFVEIPPSHIMEDGKCISMKDLNHVLYYQGKQSVLDLIQNAKDTPVPTVVDCSDVENIDLDQIDGIDIGIPDIDKYLMRLFYGTLTIVTGINGAGKTSLLSQIFCNAADDAKNAWYYSGELSNSQQKNWINCVLAGQRHCKEYEYKGAKYWKVTQEAQKNINNHYRSRWFLYRDDYDHKWSTLLSSMEDSIRKYGCKLLILDNLTAINLEANDKDKYNKQAELVSDLIKLAKKYNVAPVLVVHPHKIDTMRRLSKMDIQGISAIIDLAHRIISLYRVSDSDKKGIPSKRNDGSWYKEPIKWDVTVDILKDRLTGHEGKTAGLYYDKPSRRFFVDKEMLDRQYTWDAEKYDAELPFFPLQLELENEVYGQIQGGQ